MHVMIDLETLSTSPNAVVLSLGAVVFDEREIIRTEYMVLDAAEQIEDYKRHVSVSTVSWWMDQSAAAKAVFAHTAPISMRGALRLLDTLLPPEQWSEAKVWANGAGFDLPIIHTMYENERRKAPWRFYNERCFRTMKNQFWQVAAPATPNLVAHNAKDDALAQAAHLQAIWAHVNASK